MKKYKHKLTGITVTERSIGVYDIFFGDKIPTGNIVSVSFDLTDLNWEEVIEPNYLITAFKCNERVYKINSVGNYVNDALVFGLNHIYWTNKVPSGDGVEIVSVKNKDGIEFSVSDNTQKGKITYFKILDNIMYSGYHENGGNQSLPIDEAVKTKPSFISADGKEVKEGEAIWFSNLWSANWRYLKIESLHPDEKYFSNKESCLEYIDNNKPKYSLKDIEDAWRKLYTGTWDALEIELKKLGK